MPLVKCPECDARIATVAARCPRCGFELTEERRRSEGGGDDIECHRCRASIPSDLPVCCNCGVVSPKPYRPFLTTQRSVIVVALLVVVGGGWARFEPFSSKDNSGEAVTAVLPAQLTTPTVSIPVLRDAEKRWTLTWVNVREDRTVASPVVQVLDPGVEVEVGNREGAWWEARVDGHVVGYLSNAVLSLQRPIED